MRADEYLEGIREHPGPARGASARSARSRARALMAAATEFVLEGLHLHQKLNKEREGGAVQLPRLSRRDARRPLHAVGRHATGPARRRAGLRASSPSTCRTPTTCSRRSTGSCARASSSEQGLRVMGLDDLLEQVREAMRERYQRLQPARRPRRAARKLDELLDLERDALDGGSATPTRRAAERASSTACRAALRRARAAAQRLAARGRRARATSRTSSRSSTTSATRGLPAALRRPLPRPAAARLRRSRSS